MKKYAVGSAILFFALLIVLPVTYSVNHSAYNPAPGKSLQRADGAPMPAPIPHQAIAIIADGAPMPAPIPHGTVSDNSLIADGAPMPAPIPHSGISLVADGAPMPAPIPHGIRIVVAA